MCVSVSNEPGTVLKRFFGEYLPVEGVKRLGRGNRSEEKNVGEADPHQLHRPPIPDSRQAVRRSGSRTINISIQSEAECREWDLHVVEGDGVDRDRVGGFVVGVDVRRADVANDVHAVGDLTEDGVAVV